MDTKRCVRNAVLDPSCAKILNPINLSGAVWKHSNAGDRRNSDDHLIRLEMVVYRKPTWIFDLIGNGSALHGRSRLGVRNEFGIKPIL